MAGLENLLGAVDGVALDAPATLADFIKSVDEELEEEDVTMVVEMLREQNRIKVGFSLCFGCLAVNCLCDAGIEAFAHGDQEGYCVSRSLPWRLEGVGQVCS